jgi:KipI family sensor histidine kinase inhibitor
MDMTESPSTRPAVQPRILPCGDQALSVEFASIIDAAINARVHALDRALGAAPPEGLIETMPSYGSLLVFYDPLRTCFATLSNEIHSVCTDLVPQPTTGTNWRIPVVYGGDFGFDLPAVADMVGLDTTEVVARHITSMFEIFMIGFLPGFTYLGGLDPAIAVPRRPVPRRQVPAGSIVIGGIQAAIGSIEGPSGWHVIGRTPVRAFMPRRDPVVFMKPGDRVVFESWPPDSFEELAMAAAAGDLIAEPIA